MKNFQGTTFLSLFLITTLYYSPFVFAEGKSSATTIITPIITSDEQEEYTIAPGDIVEITVFEADELNENVRVSSTGFVTFPLLGLVKVTGLTPTKLEKHLESLLGEKYLQFPQVKVFVKESGWFFVGGSIKKPGPFPYRIGMTLTQAIAQAGGLEEKADLSEVQIIRESTGPLVISLEEILEGKTKDVVVKRNDTIFIKIARDYFVNGNVKRPGAFPYRAGITLTQAIAQAGGLDDVADPTKVRIIRVESSENTINKDPIIVNLKESESSPADDTRIKEGDTIFVPKNNLKSFWRDTLRFISVGFSKGF